MPPTEEIVESTSNKVSDDFAKELDEAVEADVKPPEDNESAGGDETTKTDTPPTDVETPSPDEKGSGEGADGELADDTEDAVTDAILERAVKAGLTMAEARQYQSGTLLESMVSRLESKNTETEGETKGEEVDGDGDDPLSKIPDLDPEEYDDKLVQAFSALKDVVRSQQQTIASLRSTTNGNPDWIKAQLAGMDKPVAEAVKADPTKVEAVRSKFAILEAGYKAAGQDVSREAVLKEAVDLALGEVITKAATDKVTRSLAKRGQQHINRPAGHRGAAPAGDPATEIADEINAKFFTKQS